MLCTEIVSDIQNNFCTQHVLPHVLRKEELLTKIYLYSTIHGHNYVGDFANGRFQGFGKFTFGTGNQTGDSYEGDFFKGEFHGNGTYFYANGDRFVGGFRFGKKTGRGILYTHDGETIPGRWRNDKLVAEVHTIHSFHPQGPFKYDVIMILTFFDPPTLSADVITLN